MPDDGAKAPVGRPQGAKHRPPRYQLLAAHYEACLEHHGDSHLGVDWPNPEDAAKRYRVMLDVVRPADVRPVSLLDFGCGASHLYEYIRRERIRGIQYSGLDISPKFIELSRSKFPGVTYYCRDVLVDDTALPDSDYVVMNGLFTEKRQMSFSEMLRFFELAVEKAYSLAKTGVAFNVMSSHVDWERADLFHLPFDRVADFLSRKLTRNFVIRNDYGLYEYTVYAYREVVR